MNIDSIKNYPAGSHAKLKHRGLGVLESKYKSTGMCDNKELNRGYYSGSFTGIGTGAAASVVKPVLKDNWFDNLLKLCDKHTVIAQNLVALVLAAMFRPVAIMSLPGKKNKDDKIYASGHSIASGLIGFGFSSVVMYPLGQAVEKSKQNVTEVAVAPLLSKNTSELGKKDLRRIDKLKDKFKVETIGQLADKIKEKFGVKDLKDLENVELFKKFKEIYKVENLAKLEQSQAFKMTTKVLDMAPDVFVFGILKAMLTIALIPPILKYGFGVEKSKPQAQPAAPVQTSTMARPDMNHFAGGLK